MPIDLLVFVVLGGGGAVPIDEGVREGGGAVPIEEVEGGDELLMTIEVLSVEEILENISMANTQHLCWDKRTSSSSTRGTISCPRQQR